MAKELDTGNVFVIDDDHAVRDSVSLLVQVHGLKVDTFATAQGFLARAPALPRGCILLDVRLPDLNGLEVMAEMQRLNVKQPTIIMTAFADVAIAVSAMKAGAVDFIEKPFSEKVLLDSIHAALRHDTGSQQHQTKSEAIASRLARLTPREKQVLALVVKGDQNKQIARVLGISPRTVEIHRARVMEKTEARSLSHLVRMTLAGDDDGAGSGDLIR